MSTPVSWVDVPDGSDFPVTNLPYGVISPRSVTRAAETPRVGVAIGDQVLCLKTTARLGLLDGTLPDPVEVFSQPTLNAFMARGRAAWRAVRERLTILLTDERYQETLAEALIPRSAIRVHLPFEVADYVDFYSSEYHAVNVGRIFRPGAEPLPPQWKQLPIGYHGRAGTVVVSGTPIMRPTGQYRTPDGPAYGPSRWLDIEAEVGFVVGVPTTYGTRLTPEDFADHVFGVVLVNDWSARDIQRWEYQPLGPFLGKAFATSISPWVVPLDALAAAQVPAPVQDPPVLDYLRESRRYGYDLTLHVRWNGTLVASPPFSTMYWTPAQQLAHLTSGGLPLRTGDLFASGTVSGPERRQCGSFLELTWNGAEPVTLADGGVRTCLEDGDRVDITATAPGIDGTVIGFGEVSGVILPSGTGGAP